MSASIFRTSEAGTRAFMMRFSGSRMSRELFRELLSAEGPSAAWRRGARSEGPPWQPPRDYPLPPCRREARSMERRSLRSPLNSTSVSLSQRVGRPRECAVRGRQSRPSAFSRLTIVFSAMVTPDRSTGVFTWGSVNVARTWGTAQQLPEEWAAALPRQGPHARVDLGISRRGRRLSRPSLYAAFGNQGALFRKALDRYKDGPAGYVREALVEPPARAVVEALLRGAVEQLSSRRHPRGCLLVQGALSCGTTADPIRRELAARRAAVEVAIRRRFKRAISDDDLPADTDAGDLARYVSTVMYGMAVRAAGGASRKELLRVVKMALRAWPAGGA